MDPRLCTCVHSIVHTPQGQHLLSRTLSAYPHSPHEAACSFRGKKERHKSPQGSCLAFINQSAASRRHMAHHGHPASRLLLFPQRTPLLTQGGGFCKVARGLPPADTDSDTETSQTTAPFFSREDRTHTSPATHTPWSRGSPRATPGGLGIWGSSYGQTTGPPDYTHFSVLPT